MAGNRSATPPEPDYEPAAEKSPDQAKSERLAEIQAQIDKLVAEREKLKGG
jgi:hypothetical protein